MRRAGADVVRWGAGDVLDRPRAADLSAHVRHLLSRRHAADFTGQRSGDARHLPQGYRPQASGAPSAVATRKMSDRSAARGG